MASDATVTLAQLAAMYGCHLSFIEDLVAQRLLPSRRVDGRVEIPLRQLNAQLRRVDRYRIPGMLPIAARPVVTIVQPAPPRRRRERPAA